MTSIHVEDLSEIRKKLTFEIHESKVDELLDAQYKDLKKNLQIRGFRRGKVPMDMIKTLYKEQVHGETARKIIEDTFELGLDEQKIKPISVLSLDPETVEYGKPFKYVAEVEVTPPVNAKDYGGLSINKTVREVKDVDVVERLDLIRERHSKLSPIPDTRGVAMGDILTVDITAEMDGQKVDSLSVTDYHVEMGRNFYLPDFDSKFEGLKVMEPAKITHTLPENFPRKELAGKTVDFIMVVSDAKVKTVPELNDEFAKDLGDYQSLDDLREKVREDLANAYEADSRSSVRKQIVEQLIERNPFEAPTTLVEQRIDDMIRESLQSLQAQGIDLKRFPMPTEEQRNQLRPVALQNVKAGIILKAIGDQEALEVSSEEIDAEVEKRASLIGVPVDFLRDHMENNNMMENFSYSILEDKVYKLIEERANVVEVPYVEPEKESPQKEAESD
ncbi:MAG: trigger factor [Syntrophaceae bacterium]|nr:trigger factor [Syntrophaceae bacterium]